MRILIRCLALLTLCAPCPPALAGDDVKPAPESAVPVLVSAQPFFLTRPGTNHLVLRGTNLTDLKELRLTGCTAPAALHWTLKDPAPAPKPGDKPKPAGEQSLNVTFTLPARGRFGTNTALIAVGPKGESRPLPLLVVAAAALVAEKEPNGGFKEAQPITAGATVSGTVGEAADVDVFRIQVRAGKKLRAVVSAASLGSALDASLSVYDSKGTLLGTNDDAGGRDPALTVTCPATGEYLVALSSAGEVAGKSAPAYLLTLTVLP